ncbi:hypothetical protein BG015_008891 [Linnemannia schmuckeri]|uniref:Uncharacterized protein n=1 Tax=Linnemannia schmuckeri TaxID=64567 RepID=A0A9P5V9T2_9FUNG|nr:hypothetical protein BG015_008891 [Linnemannia schmuckeri]
MGEESLRQRCRDLSSDSNNQVGRELWLPDMPLFGPLAFSALMESAETLEVLRIESTEELQLNDFVDVLCFARNFRLLEGIADRQRNKFTMKIMVHAYEIYLGHFENGLGRSWVLELSMEHLQLRIEGVYRSVVLYRQNEEEQLTQEDLGLDPTVRFPVQRWFYNQLSKMTGLKELILGVQDLSASTMKYVGVDSSMNVAAMEEAALSRGIHMFNYNSLEFSLESGLELLAGLKELKLLGVRRTAHDIGVAELEWIHRNWLKLERNRGLESVWRWSVHRAEGLAVKTAVED